MYTYTSRNSVTDDGNMKHTLLFVNNYELLVIDTGFPDTPLLDLEQLMQRDSVVLSVTRYYIFRGF